MSGDGLLGGASGRRANLNQNPLVVCLAIWSSRSRGGTVKPPQCSRVGKASSLPVRRTQSTVPVRSSILQVLAKLRVCPCTAPQSTVPVRSSILQASANIRVCLCTAPQSAIPVRSSILQVLVVGHSVHPKCRCIQPAISKLFADLRILAVSTVYEPDFLLRLHPVRLLSAPTHAASTAAPCA